MRALAATAHGLVELDVDGTLEPRALPAISLPLLVDADTVGARVVAVVDRRPPLAISDDAGATWREAGGGLPAGRAVAIHPDDPDLVLFAGRNRLYRSRDGGRFWAVLALELPEIERIAWRAEA